MTKKVGVFIAGRLASERLPNKLILPIGDTCLWERALEKLNALPEEIDKYALCSDSQLIEIALKYPSVKLIQRDAQTSEVDGPLTYIFKDMKNVSSTHLMFLNPCLYYLTKETILKSVKDFENSEHDYGTSVKPFVNWLFDGAGNKLMPIDYERLTTKEIAPANQTAHCFHIFHKEQFFKDGKMLKDGFMRLPVAENETIDVDTFSDYEHLVYRTWKEKKKAIARQIEVYQQRGQAVHIVDIDETICVTSGHDYAQAKPLHERIDYFNKLYDEGGLIIYSSARGFIYENEFLYRLTKDQLNSWGVKHHFLVTGEKLPGSLYWDDKAINVLDFFEEDEWID